MITKFVFSIMLELTTGVAFLALSIYGTGNAVSTPVLALASAQETIENQATTSETRTFKDSKEVESYVRKEYADTPILIDIARCESQFRQYQEDGTVIRGRVNKSDVGVMQINEKYHSQAASKLDLDIYTIEGNTAFARYLYGKYGVKPWSSSSLCWSKSRELAKK